MAANIVVPDALKAIKPYITLAGQIEQKGDKVIAYYCRLYAVDLGISINKTAPECKKFLGTLMGILEKSKTELKGDESVQSQLVGQAFVEKYALTIFKTADDDDRASKFSKNLIKQFYTAGLLFDVLNYFGELSEDLVQKKTYAKKKAAYIKMCLDNGVTPEPGSQLGDEEAGFNENANENQDVYPKNIPTMPTPQQPKPPAQTYNQPETFHNNQQPSSSSSGGVGVDALLQAQKFCKFASNAIEYEDVSTAIDNLEKCLRLLKTGKL